MHARCVCVCVCVCEGPRIGEVIASSVRKKRSDVTRLRKRRSMSLGERTAGGRQDHHVLSLPHYKVQLSPFNSLQLYTHVLSLLLPLQFHPYTTLFARSLSLVVFSSSSFLLHFIKMGIHLMIF